MDARMFAFSLAILSGFACAAALVGVLAASVRRRRAALAMQGGELTLSSLVSWRLRNGYAVLMPLARGVLAIGLVDNLVSEAVRIVESRGFTTSRETLATVVIAALAVVSVVVALLTASLIASVVVLASLCVALAMVVGNARDKREDAIRDSVPAALESMAACFGSGFTLQQTFKQVAQDVEGPLAETFERSARVLEMGGGADRALKELWHSSSTTELAFVAVALDVQHQSGGSMRQVLEAASETVKGELALRRSLRVQTAQARLSARIVAVMPLVLVSAFSLASPDFLSPFFKSVQGYALLAVAVIMQVAGISLVRRFLAVEGVS